MSQSFRLFEVGGAVRDELLGIRSKDIDFSVVLSDIRWDVNAAFDWFVNEIKKEGFKVFLETPDCFTIRAKFPKGHVHEGLVADFVLARKEVGYIENTRRPVVELGSLFDDLQRRDFTVNAIAKDEMGDLLDPFNGTRDLELKVLETPLDPVVTFMDDPLRALRAIRFAVTKDFKISTRVWNAMFQIEVWDKMEEVVSQERIQQELMKAFKADTIATLRLLRVLDNFNKRIFQIIFKDGMWLMPTNKQ